MRFLESHFRENITFLAKKVFSRKVTFQKNVTFSGNSAFDQNVIFRKLQFRGQFLKKVIFSSLQMILNLNLNNLHLVLELVYLISALIVEDE